MIKALEIILVAVMIISLFVLASIGLLIAYTYLPDLLEEVSEARYKLKSRKVDYEKECDGYCKDCINQCDGANE